MAEACKKVRRVHFDIQGEWFTWMLRHMWVEGNEHKALNLWTASFPDISTIKDIKGIFIDIVSGRKGFTGYASDENGLTIRDEKRKCWDPDQDGKDCSSFPLLQSWKDVIRLKKDQLFIAEMEILINRTYGDITSQFVYEKKYMEEHASLFDIFKLLQKNITEFFDLNQANITRKLIKDYGYYGAEDILFKWIDIEQQYFIKKYNTEMFHVDDHTINFITGALQKEKEKLERQYRYNYEWDATYHPINDISNNKEQLLDNYIAAIKDSSEKNFSKPENIETTEYDNGYINPEGNFYGCGFIQHLQLDDDLVEFFGLESKEDEEDLDVPANTQRIIEQNGWIKVTQKRYFWDSHIHIITKSQIRTVAKLMKKWKQKKPEFFGLYHKGKTNITLEEAVEANKESYNFMRRTERSKK